MQEKKYRCIVSHYESCLEKFGDTHKGVDWPKQEDVDTRYRVMLELIKQPVEERVHLLDLGCGASHMYEYIVRNNMTDIEYSGLDLSPKFIELSRRKYPSQEFYCLDLLENADKLPRFDYMVMNGVFTEKRELPFDEMFEYLESMLEAAFEKCRIGLAFNVMSKHVDWEREDLFHVPFDRLAQFLGKSLTRNYVFRNDYGLYEYTVYVYR